MDHRAINMDLVGLKSSGQKAAAASYYDYATACFVEVAGAELILAGDLTAQGRTVMGRYWLSVILSGLGKEPDPKFAKGCVKVALVIVDTVSGYVEDVYAGRFPDDEHCYHNNRRSTQKAGIKAENSWRLVCVDWLGWVKIFWSGNIIL